MMEDKDFSKEEMNQARKEFREDFERSMDLFDQQKKQFFHHLDNNICQKCGEKNSYYHYVGLDCHFEDEGIVFKEGGKAKQTRVKKSDLEFLNCRPFSCVVLCAKCHKELKLWLGIPIQDPMNEEI